MAKSEYTLRITYRPSHSARHTRKIPFNWHPSNSEVFEAVRRLRSQYQNVEILGATLTREVLVERYSIQNPNEGIKVIGGQS